MAAATERGMKFAAIVAVLLVLASTAAASTILATSSLKPPAVTRPGGFNFSVAGDFNYGAAPAGVLSKAAKANPAFLLAIGDLNYSTATDPDKEKNWCSFMKGYINNTEVVSGNHDDGQAAGDNITRIVPYCPFTLGQYNGTYGREYFFDYPAQAPLARFILTSCGLNFQAVDGFNNYFACVNKTTDSHYQFVKRAIDSAHALHIPWIIVSVHMHAVTQRDTATWVSQDFVNLMMYEHVDLFLHGHEHNYQRTSQVTCLPEGTANFNPACISTMSSPYKRGAGTVDVIVGTGGAGWASLATACPYLWWQSCNGSVFGSMTVVVTSTSLTASYISSTGSFADGFSIG